MLTSKNIIVKRLPKISIDDVINVARENCPRLDESQIRAAYEFAEKAHAGQLRETGEEYIQHPLRVAYTIAQLKLGTTAIVASLLHDIREDSLPQYYEQLGERFGDAVNFLVQGVTKLTKVKRLRQNKGSIEDLRNIFLAMTHDIRVIIIKLADRLHNIETLYALKGDKRQRIARQTLDVYAPIADRLGMGDFKGRLEDLAFIYAMPDKASWVKSQVKEAYLERKHYCDKLLKCVREELKQNNIPVIDIHGRAKRLYSLYLKLRRYNNDISQIYDLVALRVIVPHIEDCYQALGVIHRRWKPLVGKIKDYCATPKANGYQSLHTTVIIGEGNYLEIQIRTPEMHERAEHGVAATWAYAEAKRKENTAAVAATVTNAHDIAWVEQLANWQKEVDNPEEFYSTLRSDFFKNRIFCLTPTGEIINLPEGATPIDFAYSIHSKLGHRAVSAKVNNIVKPLDHQLNNGDIVEIIPGDRHQTPKREWLDFVKTSSARKQIKQWYNNLDKNKSNKIGHALLTRELDQLLNRSLDSVNEEDIKAYLKQHNYQNLEELFIAVGRGERNPHQVIKRIFPDELASHVNVSIKNLNVTVPSDRNKIIKRAHCCRPIEGDEIIGIKKDQQIIIHRTECSQLLNSKEERLPAQWILNKQRKYGVWVKIKLYHQIGVLRDVADVCAQNNINICDISMHVHDNSEAEISLLVEIINADQLTLLMRKLKALPRIISVVRRYA